MSVPALVHCGGSDDLNIASDSVVAPHLNVSCMMGEDTDGDGIIDQFDLRTATFRDGVEPNHCRTIGGTPVEIRRKRGRGLSIAAGAANAAVPPGPRSGPFNEGGNLPDDVRDVIEEAGVHNNTYVDKTYDCDNFSNDLEVALEDAGYDGTYTEVCLTRSDGSEYWHAVTDVHIEEDTYWIEPQTGKPVKLDQNGDGQVSTSTSGDPCTGRSEGGRVNVRVWDSLGDRIGELGTPDP